MFVQEQVVLLLAQQVKQVTLFGFLLLNQEFLSNLSLEEW